MTHIIAEPCIGTKDTACVDVCPVDCIYEGERMFYIHPTECIECGMCESICPVDAIRYADEVEAAEHAFIALNAAAFRKDTVALEEPGGWKKGDAPLKDPPDLAILTGKQTETRVP